MEAGVLDVGKIHILRVDPGEDVLMTVQKYLQEAEIQQAVVLGGYGTLAAHHLHWVRHNRLPTGNNVFERGEGGIEILSMNGLVVKGEPHIHVTLSTQKGAYGGHLEKGCKAYVLCEIFLAEVTGQRLKRERVPVDVPEMGKGSILRLLFSEE